MASENLNEIVHVLKTKSIRKKLVFEETKVVFSELKKIVEEVQLYLLEQMEGVEPKLTVAVLDKGQYEVRLSIAGDTIVFLMHSNVFDFPLSHRIHKYSYVQENSLNALCGVINVYNFLSDSFKYGRLNDFGYLIARIFVNNERHFYVEGKKSLGFLFNDYQNDLLEHSNLKQVVEAVIKYCLDFDLMTPPYVNVALVSVDEIETASSHMKLKTGKRLGFKFNSENDFF